MSTKKENTESMFDKASVHVAVSKPEYDQLHQKFECVLLTEHTDGAAKSESAAMGARLWRHGQYTAMNVDIQRYRNPDNSWTIQSVNVNPHWCVGTDATGDVINERDMHDMLSMLMYHLKTRSLYVRNTHTSSVVRFINLLHDLGDTTTPPVKTSRLKKTAVTCLKVSAVAAIVGGVCWAINNRD